MGFEFKNIIKNIFHSDEKETEEEELKKATLQKQVNNTLATNNTTGTGNTYNPFLKKDGSLFNPMLNYQKILDSPNVSQVAKNYITQATGLNESTNKNTQTNKDSMPKPMTMQQIKEIKERNSTQASGVQVDFNANLDSESLGSLDVINDLPKLNENQIAEIITQHFSKSPVISPSDAKGIFDAQQKTGMSALAILGIGALESGYGTSSIAKQKNNLWGWNATNSNPSGNATSFSPVSEGALQFAQNYINTYYNKYGATSIYSAGTGDNPAQKGYAYFDNNSIDASWATKVGSIMGKFYNTAKSVAPMTQTSGSNNLIDAAKRYIGKPYVYGGESMSEGGYDCSGFIYSTLRDAGYNVERTTAQGFRNYGTKVTGNMQPGDLIFYGKNGTATHIGIYIGNGQIIHSSGGRNNTKSNPGKGVSIASVNHRKDLLEVKRI